MNIYKDFGPIVSDDESKKILSNLRDLISEGGNIIVNFEGVIAMTTKSAKQIFGPLYFELSPSSFYDRITIKNASSSIKEIIYDAIANYVKNKPVS
jgi:flavodoxin